MAISTASKVDVVLSKVRVIFTRPNGNPQTAEEHSRERYRRAALAGIAASFNKVVSLSTQIVTVPLTLRYLGMERYGMWMTISSTVMMFGFADLGLSLGLINTIASALGRNDRKAARQASASAFWMLCGMASLLFVLAVGVNHYFGSSNIFNVKTPLAISESQGAVWAFLICFLLNLPLGTVRGVTNGLQRGYANDLWMIVGSVTSLVALLIGIHMQVGLPTLILCLSGPPVLAMLMNGIHLFGWEHPELAPSPGQVSRTVGVKLMRTGMMFFIIQVSMAIGLRTDNIVIARILGASAVASYAVPARLFNLVPSFLTVISGVMWPAYADAQARGDRKWIRKSFLRTATLSTAATVVITTGLVVFGNKIITLWVGPQIHIAAGLMTVLALLCILNAYLAPVSYLLNGVGAYRVLVLSAVAMAIVNIALSIYFTKRLGIMGAALGTLISQALLQVLPMQIAVNRVLRVD